VGVHLVRPLTLDNDPFIPLTRKPTRAVKIGIRGIFVGCRACSSGSSNCKTDSRNNPNATLTLWPGRPAAEFLLQYFLL
jgi:hypothetical protein